MTIHHKFRCALAAAAAGSLLTLSSCTPQQAQGAGIGGLAGGALGAAFGNDGGDVVRGAAVGAAAGAGLAALKEHNERKQGHYNSGGGRYQPPARPNPPAPQHRYKRAYKTQDPFVVVSPYAPHNRIDIRRNPKTGRPFQSGELARDRDTKEIFEVP